MTDSTVVFPPGFRVVDSDGAPVSGAQVRFFEAGTSTPKEVFSDSALSESLGSIVYTRSDGYLVAEEDSNTTVLVYIDAGLYKVDILDSDDVTIFPAKDNVQGAVDTSDFLTSSDTSSVVIPTVALAVDSSISTTYTGKLINASGNPTLTLAAPATLGDGWNVRIRCSDTGYVKIVAASGAIKGSGFSVAGLSIVGLGATLELACDGANIYVCGLVRAVAAANGRMWTIASRVASAPATTPGSFYIVSAAFGAFATGDIIEATGQATFIGYTPPSNCGWLAYVQDESLPYQWQSSAWVCLLATTAQAQAGTNNVAFMTALAVRNALPARAYAELTTSATLSTVIPFDDTIPQNTEGTQILSVSITPKSASSRIRVRFQCTFVVGSATVGAIAALFQDSIASAIAATFKYSDVAATDSKAALVLEFEHAPALAVAITYAIRIGASSGNLSINGSAVATRVLGGAARATLVVEEILT